MPTGRTKLELATRGVPRDTGGSSYLVSFNSPALGHPPASPRGSNGGHWSFAAGPAKPLERYLSCCARRRPERTLVNLGGVDARVYLTPPYPQGGIYSGHVAVVWRFGGSEHQVTVHDHRNRARAQLIALGLVRLLQRCTADTTTALCRSDILHATDGSERARPELRPRQVLAREPYMAVACRRPNSIGCDRVGLAVWTRRPTIAGRRFELDDSEWSQAPKHGLRRMFAGFLHHAGLRGSGPLAVDVEHGHNRWTGVQTVFASVHLVITYGDGSQRATTLRARLAPGWG